MNVQLRCIKGTDPKAREVIDWLLEIYNREPHFEAGTFTMNTPETVIIIYFEDVGGLILDFTSKVETPSNYFSVCHFLCVEDEHRGKGVARELVRLAKDFSEGNGYPFIGAVIDDGYQRDLWEKLGYTTQTNFGFSIVMIDREPSEL
ncbi:GNAT family N-acetyltransferase [Photobacterium angustum]|uniref:GNAT family N-acetyltransferase n=1 Tax=Photobacterium angustum TaxID=661 RepID=UPI0005E311C1|nr:GNAT family N-acetyltransferase [Photobacterium angustum]KJG00110.1 hypothetical protein UB35_19875 [Photobacterium angustum]PSV61671.1 GNAT family N-acetyltransferase [Photobacterium angustum]